MAMEKIRICVGGRTFITTKETLGRYPETRLSQLDCSSDNFDQSNNEFYFDRDPVVFGCILNFYRTHELHVTQSLCGNAVRNELKFWKISETVIAPCCWRSFHRVDQDKEVLESLIKNAGGTSDSNWRCGSSWRRRIWEAMEDPKSSLGAKIWHIVACFMILLASTVYCLDTLPELKDFPDNNTVSYQLLREGLAAGYSTRILLLIFTEYNVVILVIDKACLVFFTFELLVHLIVCPEFKKFFRGMLNWVDILTVGIGWGINLLELGHDSDIFPNVEASFNAYIVLKSVYVIRLFRMFRLMQCNSNLRIIFLSVMKCKKELILLFLSILMLAVIFGSFEYFCEDSNQKFSTIPISVWWAVVTMTTVGYGDMYPTTLCGYTIGGMCAFLGILALTLPIAVIANNFNDYYNLNQWRTRGYYKRYLLDTKSVNSNLSVETVSESVDSVGINLKTLSSENREHSEDVSNGKSVEDVPIGNVKNSEDIPYRNIA